MEKMETGASKTMCPGGDKKQLLDGGTVATLITKEMRLVLNAECESLRRLPAWVVREALKLYFSQKGL
jgi:hypothetical protein